MSRPSMRPLALVSVLLLGACSVEVDVQTEPVAQSIPVTSVGVPVYAEIAVDLPKESQGNIVTVTQVAVNGLVVNPTQSAEMELSLRLSTEGTATPDAPVLYTNLNRPAYFDRAAVLLPPQRYAAGAQTPFTLGGDALVKVVGKPRIWLIVSNTLTKTGLTPEPKTPQLDLKDVVLKAQVVKSFEGLSGAQGVLGL